MTIAGNSERELWLSITDDPDWKRNYIADPNISLEETISAIISKFPAKPRRILEIGCGYGRLTREMRAQYPTAEVWGLDVNAAVLEEAATYDPGTTFVCGDSINEQGFDAVYSVALFQHLPDSEKQAYIEQSYAALNPGGVLRVQFIPGERDAFCEHWTPAAPMRDWFRDAGFPRVSVQSGLVHPQWAWIAGKRSAKG